MNKRRIAGLTFVALAAAVAVAPPAAATDQDDFLRPLLTRFPFLTSEQLLTEADRVCSMLRAGSPTSAVSNMVSDDLDVTPSVAIDVTIASARYLDC
ncbi:DUF732 domain-containing protein [Mycolicibacterium arenosum]|uniref:DUF732 domain-containing protein n=1 Tax=Mycolicibacterium arenosum TaxID=2952157 RepID=A0ABT1M8H0_9MYCO|nr:DUF732 domain-containing protein [Mycolicibacterium sp. CAU 1645]MCP9274499.1 DUF732 domain-containing protein [Mycolicibacterium sp. CAU 1645]